MQTKKFIWCSSANNNNKTKQKPTSNPSQHYERNYLELTKSWQVTPKPHTWYLREMRKNTVLQKRLKAQLHWDSTAEQGPRPLPFLLGTQIIFPLFLLPLSPSPPLPLPLFLHSPHPPFF